MHHEERGNVVGYSRFDAVELVVTAAGRTAIFDQMTRQQIDFMRIKFAMNLFGEPPEIAAIVARLA